MRPNNNEKTYAGHQLVADLEHSAAMTKLAMESNYQDHTRECEQ